jgi:hypothetical protein
MIIAFCCSHHGGFSLSVERLAVCVSNRINNKHNRYADNKPVRVATRRSVRFPLVAKLIAVTAFHSAF